ncbi:MAG: hypothetical protein ACQXXH_04530 [Candidatus Bathyarchaeia archaeon]|jgi:hypothetical protein|nr:hypothetical protein [Candidatus Bathyarchaeota archaeon A05DMB-4]
MPTVALDDIVFERRGLVGTFRAPMGVAITIKDEKKFLKAYDKILDSLFTKYENERKKRIYKAAHLVNQILDASVTSLKISWRKFQIISYELMSFTVTFPVILFQESTFKKTLIQDGMMQIALSVL